MRARSFVSCSSLAAASASSVTKAVEASGSAISLIMDSVSAITTSVRSTDPMNFLCLSTTARTETVSADSPLRRMMSRTSPTELVSATAMTSGDM